MTSEPDEPGEKLGLPDGVADALVRELKAMNIGDIVSRADFVVRVEAAWRARNAGWEQSKRHDRFAPKAHRLAVEIADAYERLAVRVDCYAEVLGAEFLEESRTYRDIVLPARQTVQDKARDLRAIAQSWRFTASLSGPPDNPRRTWAGRNLELAANPDQRRRGGRGLKRNPDVAFAQNLGIAWREAFGLPSGAGENARFARAYRALCCSLSLNPVSPHTLRRVIGPANGRPGRPKKSM